MTRFGTADGDVAEAFVAIAEARTEEDLERALLEVCARALDATQAGFAYLSPSSAEIEGSQQVVHGESAVDPPSLASLQAVSSSGDAVERVVGNEVLLCLPIRSGDTRLGAAWFVVPASRLGEADRSVLEALVRAFAARVQQLRVQKRERKQAEETALRVRFVEQLVGALGHDLRGPLQVIAASAQLLARTPTPEVVGRSAERITRNVKRSSQMVEDLLDFIRIDRGLDLSTRRVTLDVCQLAGEIVEDFRVHHPNARIELVTCAGAVGHFDAARVAQLFTNLLTNALRYGDPDQPVRITLEATDDEVLFTVHNYGPAIPPQLQPVLFDPFRRAQTGAQRREHTGLGLGLFIVRHVVLAHGGAIDVSSSEQEGTTFTVVLPKR